jgi:alanine-synthesizing transaminase
MAVGRTPRLDGLLGGLRKLADGRLCSPGPMQYAITAALRGDKTFQQTLRADLRERAEITTTRLNDIPGMTCVRPQGAFYAMPQVALPPGRTDADFVLGLLRATGVLTVFGSGFGTDPAMGAFRVVFLAPPAELHRIYDLIAGFTGDFLAGRTTGA